MLLLLMLTLHFPAMVLMALNGSDRLKTWFGEASTSAEAFMRQQFTLIKTISTASILNCMLQRLFIPTTSVPAFQVAQASSAWGSDRLSGPNSRTITLRKPTTLCQTIGQM